MELIKASLMAVAGGGGGSSANIQPKPDTITRNGRYYARDDQLDGYESVYVLVDIPPQQPFQFSDGASLEDITPLIDPDDTVLPSGTTQYIPHVYLAVYEGTDPETGKEIFDIMRTSKTYTGTSTTRSLTLLIDITDADTGQSVEGYPKRIQSYNAEIRDGGVFELDKWTVDSQGGLKAWWHYRVATGTQEQDREQYAHDSLRFLGSYTTDQAFRVNNPASNNS